MPPLPLGTLVNVATVIAGSLLGLLLHKSFPERFRQIQFQATGLFTLALGAQMAVKSENPLLLVFSLLLGGLLGEWLRLEDGMQRLAEKLKGRFENDSSGAGPAPIEEDRPKSNSSGAGPAPIEEDRRPVAGATQEDNRRPAAAATARVGGPATSRFSEGLLTAFLIFCIGPMTILGALDEGIRGEHSLLFTKALLDGFTSMALASTYGVGVLLSVIPLFIFQAGISYAGFLTQGLLTDSFSLALTSTGGVLILGLGLNLLGVTKIRVSNLLPALPLAVVLVKMLEIWNK